MAYGRGAELTSASAPPGAPARAPMAMEVSARMFVGPGAEGWHARANGQCEFRRGLAHLPQLGEEGGGLEEAGDARGREHLARGRDEDDGGQPLDPVAARE